MRERPIKTESKGEKEEVRNKLGKVEEYNKKKEDKTVDLGR